MKVYSSSLLSQSPFLMHGFLTRQGGVSKGDYATLNVSDKTDDVSHVEQNLNRIARHFSVALDKVITLKQVHGKAIHYVDEDFLARYPSLKDGSMGSNYFVDGDALISSIPGVLIGIKTADCVPILLVETTKPLLPLFMPDGKVRVQVLLTKLLIR